MLFLTICLAQNRLGQTKKQGSRQNNLMEITNNTSDESVPRRISYQGLITKADGTPTDDGSYEVLFKIFDVADGGDAIWFENQEVTVNSGIISTILGNTNPFSFIPKEAYLELTVDGSTLSPRQVLTSVFYSVLSDTASYAEKANYDDLDNLPDLNVYLLKDSLDSYTTTAELFDTLSAYQQVDSNLTDLVEDGILSASKVEFGVTSSGTAGESWISDGDGSGTWGIPTAIAADDIIVGDGNIFIKTNSGDINIIPDDESAVIFDSTITITGKHIGLVDNYDLIGLSNDTVYVDGTVSATFITGQAVLDEDDLVSNSDRHLATQQSIKSYIDTKYVSGNVDIDGGTIDGTVIGAENPQTGSFTTVQAQSRAYVGDITIDSGSISSESGSVSIGNLTISNGAIASSTNEIDFGDDDLSTTGTLNTGVATLESGSTIGNLTFTDGTIASASNNISFGNENLSTNGTLTAGVSTLSSGSEIGDLTLADGSITSSSDAIDFGNDALSTTGTISAGTATLETGSTVGDLTLADGSITSSSDAIDFGNNTLTTSSTITANAFAGDGSNITGVEASSMGTLVGASPIVLEGESIDDFETTLSVEDPTLSDKTITFPNVTGTIITTGNDSAIDEVGTITSGQWQGTAIADEYVPDDITLSGATIDNSVIGGTTPAVATVTIITANEGIVPDESDGAFLGTSSAEFSDLFLADGAVINLGDEQDVTLTHVEDTGIKLNGTNQLQFGDSGTQISQSADGVLDLVSDNEVEINGTTIDMNGTVDVSGAIPA
ncbi:MAG: hypothetical protein CMG57_04825, partial [Candidatus Marinimicrobia bacterium]|nr:hypothetical protein [Candidatus Neomarinimicrobiota bacterium]